MAATSAPAAPAVRPASLPAATGQAGIPGALRSEFTKIRSTRSTYWTLLALVVVTVGFGALASWGAASHAKGLGPGFDPTQRSLGGLYIGQLIIAVLGALAITSEYSTGMIRTSLTAMPRRGTVFAAKAVVFATIAFVTGLITSFAAFFLGQALMSGQHINATLGQPDVLRAVIGGALFLTICGLLAFGIGMILRHTAGAITASIGLLFVLSILVNFLPQSWQADINKWMPTIAGSQIWATRASADGGAPMFSAWTGLAVFAGYAAIAVIAGVILFRRRDA
ncbi:MAG TPA: ABC transporter permease subunit [Streptosporangiaceae bacterium]|jgi:ABC-2 type transport system permease protein